MGPTYYQPVPKRPKNCKTQQSNTPHHPNITSQQEYPILHAN